MNNARAMAIVRIVASAIATINLVLAAKGRSPIPFDEENVELAVALVLQGAAALWAWWRNNDMTEAAFEGTGLTRLLKSNDAVDPEQLEEGEEVEDGEEDEEDE